MTTHPQTITIIKCPNCGNEITWCETEKFRPFCSKRCQMADFGEWAFERNIIPEGESEIFSADILSSSPNSTNLN